ncbi:MAG: TIGR00730 family Rossman fold protein [Pseudomonadota bacterium]
MQRVCVFCGANNGTQPVFQQKARALGEVLAKEGLGVVYGGAKVGLMGAVADAALSHGGEVIGVIPEALMKKELAHEGLAALHVVKSMHERKAMMADLADGFIALPGGFGTMDETFEIVTWSQLGFHKKPCAVLDVEDYYEHLKKFIENMIDNGFAKPGHADLLLHGDEPLALLKQMRDFEWQPVKKWTDQDIR